MSRAPAESSSSSTAAAVPQTCRPLCAGLPSRDEALKQQLSNLHTFVEQNAAAFAEMPYLPWTKPLHGGSAAAASARFHVRPADPPLRGLKGVFTQVSVPAKDEAQALLEYPGLLVTEKLYEECYNRYHCPTGLHLPALSYNNDAGKDVNVLIIGDPTSLGALINDGEYGRNDGECREYASVGVVVLSVADVIVSRPCFCCAFADSAVNCQLLSVRASDSANVLGPKNKDGKRQVNSKVARVWTLADVAILKNTELLLSYGEDFWKAKKYCQYCFKRSVSANNPLVLCSGHSHGKKQCDIARHRLCFNQTPSLSDLNNAEVKYFCPDHLMHAASPGVSSKPKATPRAAAAFSNPAFTPPPKVAPITTRKSPIGPRWCEHRQCAPGMWTDLPV